jgi:ribosome-binding protein aMBF1 (putative translation factor)
MECSNCGISGNKTRLLDVISSKGIIKVCENCFKDEEMPVFRKPTTFQLKESEKNQSIYYRLSKAAGIKTSEKKEPEKKEIGLKEIIDRNFEKTASKGEKPRSDLVDNFHWVLMRARRLKKLTIKDLAKELSESEVALKMAEQGSLPEDDYRLVNKLESFLGIKLVKDDIQERPEKLPSRVIKFDPESAKNLTIADLKKLKDEKEAKILGGSESEKE